MKLFGLVSGDASCRGRLVGFLVQRLLENCFDYCSFRRDILTHYFLTFHFFFFKLVTFNKVITGIVSFVFGIN